MWRLCMTTGERIAPKREGLRGGFRLSAGICTCCSRMSISLIASRSFPVPRAHTCNFGAPMTSQGVTPTGDHLMGICSAASSPPLRGGHAISVEGFHSRFARASVCLTISFFRFPGAIPFPLPLPCNTESKGSPTPCQVSLRRRT